MLNDTSPGYMVHDEFEHESNYGIVSLTTRLHSCCLIVLEYFYPWLCEAGHLCICVYMFRYSVISVRRDVVRQQWLGGTAEWSDFLSMALSLLGNRLAPRLRTSPFRWPQTQRQKWGMGMGTVCCQSLLSVKVQAWFISMLLNLLWLCHFFSLSGHNLGWLPWPLTLPFSQGCCLLGAYNEYA